MGMSFGASVIFAVAIFKASASSSGLGPHSGSQKSACSTSNRHPSSGQPNRFRISVSSSERQFGKCSAVGSAVCRNARRSDGKQKLTFLSAISTSRSVRPLSNSKSTPLSIAIMSSQCPLPTAGSCLLGTVVRHHSNHFPSLRQLQELSRASSLLICVVEQHAVNSPEHVLKAKV